MSELLKIEKVNSHLTKNTDWKDLVNSCYKEEFENEQKVLGDTDYHSDEVDNAVPVFFFTVQEIMEKYKDFLGLVLEGENTAEVNEQIVTENEIEERETPTQPLEEPLNGEKEGSDQK